MVAEVVFYLVYVSSAMALLSPSELNDILTTSRARNAAAGVTGALLYSDGNLMQVLEGDEPVVRSLYDDISRDRRHSGLITVMQGHQDERQFEDWSMAYRDQALTSSEKPQGYSDFLNTPFTAAEFGARPTKCQRLLTSFKQRLGPT